MTISFIELSLLNILKIFQHSAHNRDRASEGYMHREKNTVRCPGNVKIAAVPLCGMKCVGTMYFRFSSVIKTIQTEFPSKARSKNFFCIGR